MSLQTPRQRPGGAGLGSSIQRPSYSANGTSPHSTNSGASTSAAVNRKASLQALTGQPDPRTPSSSHKMAGSNELEVGDPVNVPGDMYGVVKFLGTVRGKNGKFVGVELDKEFAARGKNDGDVEGIHYFRTSVPGAGIFLPVHRAERRDSSALSVRDTFPDSPDTPTYSTVNGTHTKSSALKSSTTHRFAQTVGPGARPPSPQFKPKRPSLPRPESPFRKPAPNLQPTPARNLSQTVRGGGGVTPGKSNNLRASTTTTSRQTPVRPYSRTGSRAGYRGGSGDEDKTPVGSAITSNDTSRTMSQSSVPSFSQPLRSPSRLGSAGGEQELQRLKQQLQERDRRLEEQAASLADMEQSVKELSSIIPSSSDNDGTPRAGPRKGSGSSSSEADDPQSASQLRQALREKNEKISLLTAEFDAHRADFRSTLDSLEMASTETERVYEEQKRDLLAQLSELQEVSQSKEDFEGVAQQLKQLEELVAELEEGLEESRRGEAEARGEVEFLRGEVERGRSELKRERDVAATAVGSAQHGGGFAKEMEGKEDEIRGLKAIIHHLGETGGGAKDDSEEVERLQAALDESRQRKEELEEELEHLRRSTAITTNGHARNESDRTATATEPVRPRANTIKPTFAQHAQRQESRNGVPSTPDDVYCEMCQSASHDTLDCTTLHHAGGGEKPYSPGKENQQQNGKAGKGGVSLAAEDKWCALCEMDGHLAFDCPNEQY